ncbi:MAG: glucose-1-phosphate adenylyltransferase [bacterium]
MERVLATILGGGRGTRLYPLTKYRSKPAVPLAGKYRLIDIPISNCINSEIRSIFVLTQYNSASLNHHVSMTYKFDHFSSGFVDILAAEQTMDHEDWYQGSADSIRRNWRHLDAPFFDDIIILSGDALFRMDLRKLVAHHRKTDSDVTVSVKTVSAQEAPSFGILKINRETSILEFHEKPPSSKVSGLEADPAVLRDFKIEDASRPYLASMGIYVFRKKALEKLLADESKTDFGKELIPDAIGRMKVSAFIFDDYWEDIGTIKTFYQANIDVTRPDRPFDFYDPSGPIYTRARYLPGSHVYDCTIDQSILCEGCVLRKATVRRSVLGIRLMVSQGVTIEDSVIMGSDYYEEQTESAEELQPTYYPLKLGIGEGSIIRKAIVDKNARIGKGVRIVNEGNVSHADGPNYYIRDGIVIIPKNYEVPDGTVI